jgi:hypothetical protein
MDKIFNLYTVDASKDLSTIEYQGSFSTYAKAESHFAEFMQKEGYFSRISEISIDNPETEKYIGGTWSYPAQMTYHDKDIPNAEETSSGKA